MAEATHGDMMKLLESLPPKSVVIDHDQDAWQKDDEGLWTCAVRVANTEAMGAESVAIMGLLYVAYVGARADGCRCYPGSYCGGPDCAPPSDDDLRAESDQALAAHNAELREHARHEFCDSRLGCVVAEEPEWEYGVGWNYVGATAPMGTRYPSRESAEDCIRRYPQDQDFGPNYLVRRRPEQPAGPWVPVKQEDQTTNHEIRRQP